MYNSFSASTRGTSPPPEPPPELTTTSGSTTTSAPTSSTGSGPGRVKLQQKQDKQLKQRKKRAQVSRACDMCRLHRIKCDNNPECSSCINRGVRCTNSGSKPAYTLSSAIQRIEELEELSKRLKEELALYKKSGAISPANQEAGAGSPSGAESSSGTRRHVDSNEGASIPLSVYFTSNELIEAREGLSSVDPTTEQTEFYGSTSPFYFFAKISSFLTTNKTLPPLSTVIPHLAACDLATPAKGKGGNDYSMLNPEDEFSRAQQDYFLGLYWQSYHVMLPVISQKEFREHYESLWPDPELYPNQPRKPSPLVDIVLALCAQYGTNSVVPVHRENLQGGNPAASNNASIAGSGYFRRCQAALVTSLEKPTMVAVQCYILTIFYLLNASYTNMAYNTLGLAIRLAHTLGYYREPNPELPEPKKQLLRRIWWVLYALDIRLALDTGRPLGLQEHQITCNLPSDVEDAGLNGGLSNPSGSSNGNFSWLSFILHGAKLYTVCHMILKVVYCILWQRARDPTPPNIEEIGLNLTKSMPPLLQWRDNLPAQLKPARKNGGTPMSTDMTPVEFDYFTPMWLQRQRLTAEMHWHNFGVILHRGFICFSPSTAQTPIADGHAITCMKHARANTALIHQVLTQTDVLNGWYETYYFQWSATMTIIGFLLSYPFYPHAQEARASVDTGLEVFDLFAVNYPAAGHSARITREFLANIDPLLERIRRDPAVGEQRRRATLGAQMSVSSPPTRDQVHIAVVPRPPTPPEVDSQLPEGQPPVGPANTYTGHPPDQLNEPNPEVVDANMLDLWNVYETDLETIFGSMKSFEGGPEPEVNWASELWPGQGEGW